MNPRDGWTGLLILFRQFMARTATMRHYQLSANCPAAIAKSCGRRRLLARERLERPLLSDPRQISSAEQGRPPQRADLMAGKAAHGEKQSLAARAIARRIIAGRRRLLARRD
jgi:hypothetical protein